MSGGAPMVLRGSPSRITDSMEQFQISYISAIAAAAGCNVVGAPTIDEGIDFMLTHKSDQHVKSGAVPLEIQLKSTTQYDGLDVDYLESDMRADRYAEFTSLDPNINRIVVIMSIPKDQSTWLEASHEQLVLRNCSYWANLAGLPASTAKRPTFRTPKSKIFDDVALCGIMQRIGQGDRP